jgi:hypothetical protein
MILMIFLGSLAAIYLRYQIQRSQACLYWGVKIAPQDFLATNPTGLQDAISPAAWTLPFYAALAATLGVTIFSFWDLGWSGLAVLAASLLTSSIYGVLALPKPESRHFLDAILRHLANRAADYKKQGDSERFNAAFALHQRLFEVSEAGSEKV